MRKFLAASAMVAAFLLPAPADAATYTLSYTSSSGITSSPVFTVNATLTTSDTPFFGQAGRFQITGITGTRTTTTSTNVVTTNSITGINDFDTFNDSTLYIPPTYAGSKYFDTEGLTFTVNDGFSYNLFANNIYPYAEFRFVTDSGDDSTGSLNVVVPAVAVAPFAASVPEPATWLSLVIGLGATGGLLRRRRARAVLAA